VADRGYLNRNRKILEFLIGARVFNGLELYTGLNHLSSVIFTGVTMVAEDTAPVAASEARVIFAVGDTFFLEIEVDGVNLLEISAAVG